MLVDKINSGFLPAKLKGLHVPFCGKAMYTSAPLFVDIFTKLTVASTVAELEARKSHAPRAS